MTPIDKIILVGIIMASWTVIGWLVTEVMFHALFRINGRIPEWDELGAGWQTCYILSLGPIGWIAALIEAARAENNDIE